MKDEFENLVEVVHSIKDNAATKQELDKGLRQVKSELEQKIAATKNELITHIDGFAKKQQTFDVELTALRAQIQ